ncbi:hypothetical protein C241_16348 [Bradyrhizobium lupini HPC(L)]|uniref:Uncharacterized protein n=1 Tax=Bradyrhizobium lupini HPC(L) TaxID=1229491 RepID=A0ABP2RQQ1_RHILU|nr:hypothetical protein C241_16348 [Bradyrhizobium lupini HPC(L)]
MLVIIFDGLDLHIPNRATESSMAMHDLLWLKADLDRSDFDDDNNMVHGGARMMRVCLQGGNPTWRSVR